MLSVFQSIKALALSLPGKCVVATFPFSAMALSAGLLSAMTLPAWTAPPPLSSVDDIKKHLLVVYNENAAESRELAYAYASARKLERRQIFAIQCPDQEEITRQTYDSLIRQPIRQFMLNKDLLEVTDSMVNFGNSVKKAKVARKNEIWAMVLIRGVPLKIKNNPNLTAPENTPALFKRNEAAVDSELSLILCDPIELNGFVPNPYFSETSLRPFNSKLALSLVLVTRLDAPEPSDVYRMIRDSVNTEKLELTGRACFDSRGIRDNQSGYKVGDDWIRSAASDARTAGLEVTHDDLPDVFGPKVPLEDIALYAGWYTGDFQGPFNREGFHFRPGAVAYHLHSFSAATIRDKTHHWVGPLLSHGVTATMGSVYEPYLRLTPNLRTFFRSLLSGQCFAEAAYQSQPALSWTLTMVGDPLYRPYPRDPMESARIAQNTHDDRSPWLCLRFARLLCHKSLSNEDKIDRITRMVNALPDPVTYEGLGDILTDLKAPSESIVAAYRRAESLSKTSAGKIRNGLHIADHYASQNEISRTMAAYERLLSEYPQASRAFDVPDLAISYATRNGWDQFSPELQSFLAPVGEPLQNPQESDIIKTPPKNPGHPPHTYTEKLPAKPRKDLIPGKPVLAPQKSGPDGKAPPYRDPNYLPSP